MTEADLKELGQALGRALLSKRSGPVGRQRDRGANLIPDGVLILPLFSDPGQPGKVYTADMVAAGNLADPQDGYLQVHNVVTVRDGKVGGKDTVKPLGGGLGNAVQVLGALGSLGLLGPVGAAVGGLATPPPLPKIDDPDVARVQALLQLLRSTQTP